MTQRLMPVAEASSQDSDCLAASSAGYGKQQDWTFVGVACKRRMATMHLVMQHAAGCAVA